MSASTVAIALNIDTQLNNTSIHSNFTQLLLLMVANYSKLCVYYF